MLLRYDCFVPFMLPLDICIKDYVTAQLSRQEGRENGKGIRTFVEGKGALTP